MDGTRFGMGVAMGKEVFSYYGENLTVLDFPCIYFPIQFGSTFRLEPEFGFYRYDHNSTYTTMLIGCGVFLTRYWGSFDLYYGARAGMYRHSGTYEDIDEYDYKRNDFVVSPTIGAECFLCQRRLSLGGEFQFNYLMYGKEELDGVKADDAPKVMKTKTLFFIRWFFGR